jgi:hypothetical protein
MRRRLEVARNAMRRFLVLPATWLFTALLASCGYTAGSGLSQHGIRTVAFQVVGNETYRQRLEVEISHFLARELPVATDLTLADRRSADAVLQVILMDVRERTLVQGRPSSKPTAPIPPSVGFPRTAEGALEGAVVLRLIRADGTVYLERTLLDRTEFRAAIGENLTTARAEMAEDLARKIALALESDF